MSEEKTFFTDETTYDDLERSLPPGWMLADGDLITYDIAFSFPFPKEVDDVISVNAAVSNVNDVYPDAADLFMGCDPIKEDDEVVGRRFVIEADWPLPNNIIDILSAAGILVGESCADALQKHASQDDDLIG